MTDNWLLFSACFAWSLCLTPLSIHISRQYGIIDEPGGRKTHIKATPRGAGVVLWLGYMLYSLILPEAASGFRIIPTAATAVFIFGYIDDMRPLPALWKLGVHAIASFAVVLFIPAALPVRLLFFIWITGSTSAYNLIDGINGLSLAIFALTACAGFYLSGEAWWIALLGLSCGVFLWNYPVARTFLGDGGSTLLGFICMSQFSLELPSMVGEASFFRWILITAFLGGIPVFDTVYSFIRRLAVGKSPFRPDRGHFHHILCDRGMPASLALFTLLTVHAGALLLAIALIGGHLETLWG